MNPSDMVEMLAARKARAVAALLDDGIVIGADTVVVLTVKRWANLLI